MDNKGKIIEEMANIPHKCIKTSCEECIKNDMKCADYTRAEAIYNAGYRKIDDDCAVITKAELKQYKAQAVKDFAEKVKMAFFYEFDEIIPSIMSDKIDELIKEFEK